MNTFYGFKIGQGQDFDDKGRRWPVSMIKVDPMTIVSSHQVAFGAAKKINKPLSGLLKSLTEKISPKFIKEYEVKDKSVGEKLAISDIFNVGDKISVSGTMKGKGFAGVVKRHGFKGGPKTHGQSDRQRHPGSIGQTTTPGRVYKGKRMAGHMGNVKRSVTNLAVFAIRPEENTLVVRGLIPGAVGGLVTIKK